VSLIEPPEHDGRDGGEHRIGNKRDPGPQRHPECRRQNCRREDADPRDKLHQPESAAPRVRIWGEVGNKRFLGRFGQDRVQAVQSEHHPRQPDRTPERQPCGDEIHRRVHQPPKANKRDPVRAITLSARPDGTERSDHVQQRPEQRQKPQRDRLRVADFDEPLVRDREQEHVA